MRKKKTPRPKRYTLDEARKILLEAGEVAEPLEMVKLQVELRVFRDLFYKVVGIPVDNHLRGWSHGNCSASSFC